MRSIAMANRRGFTLIEIAVVLFIVSVILAALLNADSVIRASKVQDVVAMAKDLSTAVNSFKQRFHMLPGDFPMNIALPEIPNISKPCHIGGQRGDANGLIDNGGNAPGFLGVAAEAQCVPEFLFGAGLVGKIEVDPGSGVMVFQHKFGGRVWVKSVAGANGSNVVAVLGAATFPPSVTHVIEFENLPCSAASDVDRQIDNGNLGSGRAVASIPNCAGDALVDYAIVL